MLKINFSGQYVEAGLDEAGRGCFAGPVMAAAVILPENFSHPALNDSKQMSLEMRLELRQVIEQAAIAYAVGVVDNIMIDKINILNASIMAMHRALDKLATRPQLLLVDGNRFHDYKEIPFHCIVKGDATYMSIAAASVLAKTCRDDHMDKLHMEHPQYNWKKNKGYPTPGHKAAIAEFGVTEYHRLSFNMNEQLKLF